MKHGRESRPDPSGSPEGPRQDDGAASSGIAHLQALLSQFYSEREWEQFHTLKDLAAGISVEAGELQELFLWRSNEDEGGFLAQHREDVMAELADVLIYALNFARLAEIDVETAVAAKVRQNAEKYPASEVRGRVVGPNYEGESRT